MNFYALKFIDIIHRYKIIFDIADLRTSGYKEVEANFLILNGTFSITFFSSFNFMLNYVSSICLSLSVFEKFAFICQI